MKDLLHLLSQSFINAGSGDVCPFFMWGEFEENDLFWIIPCTRYFAVYRQCDEKIEFYRIVNSSDDIPKDCTHAIEKVTRTEDGLILDAFFCQVSSYEIIEKFGKRYKFLLYHLDSFIE